VGAKVNRVPQRERDFLVDQRTDRQLFIGAIDKKVTTTLQKRAERKSKELALSASAKTKESNDGIFEFSYNDQADGVSSHSDNALNEHAASSGTDEDVAGPSSDRNLTALSNTAAICDRYVITDRSAAVLVNAVLQDYGVLSEKNPSLVTDRHKLRRERQRVRESLQKEGDESGLPA